MFNLDVRAAIRQSGFFGYEVAAALGISETSFSRLLSRSELSTEKQKHVLETIESMSAKREATNAAD